MIDFEFVLAEHSPGQILDDLVFNFGVLLVSIVMIQIFRSLNLLQDGVVLHILEILEWVFIFARQVLEVGCVEWNGLSIDLALRQLRIFMLKLSILFQLLIKDTTLFNWNAMPHLPRPEFVKHFLFQLIDLANYFPKPTPGSVMPSEFVSVERRHHVNEVSVFFGGRLATRFV